MQASARNIGDGAWPQEASRRGHVDHRIHGLQNILGQMAFDVMASPKITHRRDLALTQIVSDLILVQAARLEWAAGRRLQGRGNFALQHDMFFLNPRVGDGIADSSASV